MCLARQPPAPPCVPFAAQDYIDSMEGATLSGRQCAYSILEETPRIAKELQAAQRPLAAV